MAAALTTTLLLYLPFAAPAGAVSLSLQSESAPFPGVTLREYRVSDPSTDAYVLLVDLCADGVHIDATKAPGGATAGGWAEDRGARAATNGDFYRTSPSRVYGNAVGEGIPWPLENTGDDPAYSGEWYFEDYGWIAFGPDTAEFTHTGWVKDNVAGLSAGWRNDTPAPPPPPDTLALVSGFPELVIEGSPVTCGSPSDDDCFPDRSDMADRHPRTAMGLTQDRETFILAVVDGRTSSASGMYGIELADLMHQLGAWVAFNLDGGGSSQLWVEDQGYVNDTSGNNSGGGTRSVINHWGVFSGGVMPDRPGHCASAPPCDVLPPEGGIIDDDSACFRLFGNPDYWREESAGHGGRLYWTNAWQTDQPEDWAWWQLHLEQAGEYRVEVYREPEFSVYDAPRYRVLADGVAAELSLAPPDSEGWQSLGELRFAAGGGQHIAVFDDSAGSVASDQHIAADAVRLVRLDLPEDTGGPLDSDAPADSADPGGPGGGPGGPGDGPEGDDAPEGAAPWDRAPLPDQGCSSAPAPLVCWLLAAPLLWRRESRCLRR